MNPVRCADCGNTLDDYDTDDDIGWCSTCRVFVGDFGDFPFAGLECRICREVVDLDRQHRPNPWEFMRGTLDDPCSSCQRKHHPSLTAEERNRS